MHIIFTKNKKNGAAESKEEDGKPQRQSVTLFLSQTADRSALQGAIPERCKLGGQKRSNT